MSARCSLCPRACGADRVGGVGYCGVPDEIFVCRAAPHFGEEPCISGTRGSGAVFFSPGATCAASIARTTPSAVAAQGAR